MTYEQKLETAKAQLGARYVLHPEYKPLPYQSASHKESHFLAPVKLKAMQEGRLVS